MNKLFTKIGVAMVGFAMAVGVGIAANSNKNIHSVQSLGGTDSLTYSFTGVGSQSGTGYKPWSGKTGSSGAVYAGQSNKLSSGSSYIQIRATSPSGIVSTTTGGNLSSITLTFSSSQSTKDGNYVTVFGKTSAYTEPADLYDNNKKGTQIGTFTKANGTQDPTTAGVTGKSTASGKTLTITGSYQYVGFLASAAVYIDNISITWAASTDPYVTITSNVSMLKVKDNTTTITATASNSASVSFSSSNTNVATIDSSTGVLTAKGMGTTTITASAQGATSATLNFKVLSNHTGLSSDSPLSGQEALNFYNNLTGEDKTAEYYFGGYVTEFGNYQTTDYIIDGTEFDLYDPQAGQGVDLDDVIEGSSYVVAQGTMTNDSTDIYSYQPTIVSVVNPVLDHIVVSESLSTPTYKNTDTEWDTSGLVVTAYYTNESSRVVTPDSWSYSVDSPFAVDLGNDSSKEITVRFTASWSGETAYSDQVVTITKNALTSLSFGGGNPKNEFGVGDKFSLGNGITLKANRTSGSITLDLANVVVKLGGNTINISTYTFVIGDNGKTIDISYTEHGVTKSLSDANPSKAYAISVSNILIADYSFSSLGNSDVELQDVAINLDSNVSATAHNSATGQNIYDPKYYSSDSTARLYQNGETGKTTLTISLPEYGYELQSVNITFSVKNNGTIALVSDSSVTLTSGENYSCSGKSLALTIGNSSSGTNGNVKITSIVVKYTYDKVGTWCDSFLNTFTCSGVTVQNPNGAITVANPTTVWGTFNTSFTSGAGLSNAEKAVLKTTAANEEGNIIGRALARYDLVIRKYGESAYTDFIGRFSAGGANASINLNNSLNSNNSDSMPLIIAISSAIALVSVAGYFMIRRKKEN